MEAMKVILITGANSGIGKVTAIELAKKGHVIVMVCRDKNRGEVALLDVLKESGNDNVHLMTCDLSSLESIKTFCIAFKSRYCCLDILINNAGTMNQERKLTIDGFEMHFQVNYLGPFLLTSLLLDIIKPNGRIINVASLAHKIGNINFNDINLNKGFSMFRAYSQSKLALILFTYELSHRIEDKGIIVNCLHPGTIISNLGVYKNRKLINYLTEKLKWLFTSKEKGAETTIYLATSSDVLSGHYFYKKKIIKSSRKSYDQNLSKKLWLFSLELLGLNEA